MFMNILKARDVAMLPADHTDDERKTAFRALHASADKNKDRARAAADRRLAKALWDSLGRRPRSDLIDSHYAAVAGSSNGTE
jgi:hypothetical protein